MTLTPKSSDRPEGGREAPARGGGTGAASLTRGDSGDVSHKWPIRIGVGVSIVIAVLAFVLGAENRCEVVSLPLVVCQSNFQWLIASPPNEIGDTLAGFAGVLAFVWIIVTVWLQSLELRAQREELKLTRQEFEKMADAQDEQVKLLVKQGEIFEQEQREREYAAVSLDFDSKLRLILRYLNHGFLFRAGYHYRANVSLEENCEAAIDALIKTPLDVLTQNEKTNFLSIEEPIKNEIAKIITMRQSFSCYQEDRYKYLRLNLLSIELQRLKQIALESAST